MGIILGATSDVALEVLATELQRLNAETASAIWPNMVVVMNEGVISYGLQFPGDEDMSDFLPPHPEALANHVPAVYLTTLITPTGPSAFRRMCAYLIPHLKLFSPDAKLADWEELKKNLPANALTLAGYQYNLAGHLTPVPRQFCRDRFLLAPPHLISDHQGKVLAAVNYLQWQDGGVIMLRGQLPP